MNVSDVSVENVAFTFRVEEYAKRGTNMNPCFLL
jgi:hypothetical protein